MTTDRDQAFAELEAAGVIERTNQIDENDNPIFRMRGIPAWCGRLEAQGAV